MIDKAGGGPFGKNRCPTPDEAVGNMAKDPDKQATLYIGLNDSETGKQKFGTEKYLSVLRSVCHSYKVAFSCQVIGGGYFHEDGRYTEENTLMLKPLGVPEETVMEIAKDLCAFFNQESVMLTYAPCSVIFVKESLDAADQ